MPSVQKIKRIEVDGEIRDVVDPGTEQEIAELKENVTNLFDIYDSVKTELAGLKKDIDSLNTTVTNVSLAVFDLQNNMSTLSGKIESATQIARNAEEVSKNNAVIIEEQQTSLNNLKKDVSNNTKDISDLNAKVSGEISGRIDSLEKSVEAIGKDVNELKTFIQYRENDECLVFKKIGGE